MTFGEGKGNGEEGQKVACPIRTDCNYGTEFPELVISLESEFTVGTRWELLDRALIFIEQKCQPLHGAPIRFIAAPDWTVKGIDKLREVAA